MSIELLKRTITIRLAMIGLSLFAVIVIVFVLVNMLTSQVFAQSSQENLSQGRRIVSIYDRGEERIIVTKASTVAEALKSAKITISAGKDVVEPALDTELITSTYKVNIYRARPVTIVDGQTRLRVTTAHQVPKQIAESAGLSLYDEDKLSIGSAENLLIDGADVVMTIDRATPIQFTLYGKKTEVRTHAATVGQFLTEKGLKIGQDDSLSAPVDQPIVANMSLELWREGKQTITQEEETDFPIEKIYDANRPMNYREVTEPGEKGKRDVTYEVEIKNGQEVGRKEIASITTKEPKKQIEVVGAKNSGNPLTKSKGVNMFTDSNGVTHRETYYDLPMAVVMGNCGAGGYYTVRSDGAKVDRDGYVIIAAHLGNYPRCSVVETSMGLGKVYDTGGFTSNHPHGFDLATDWTRADGV